jgi:hypothetical protein
MARAKRPLGGADLPVGGGLPVPAADLPGDGGRECRRAPLATAAWAFPLYLFLISLFVVPIAVVGLALLPGTNSDLFVLTLPLASGARIWRFCPFSGASARRPRW